MALVAVLLAVVVGAVIPLQTGVNTRVARWIGVTLLASLVSFAVGFAGLVVINLVARNRPRRTGRAPWWSFLGG